MEEITFIENAGTDKRRNRLGVFKCYCGNEFTARITYIKNNVVKSCGCLQKEKVKAIGHKNKTHGMTESKEYAIYKTMRQRCYNPNNKQYKDYGGRGIFMSDDWKASFNNFHRDMGDKPEGKSVHRIDNDGPYSKENCMWATMKEHGTAMRSNHLLEYNGETKTIVQWSETTGIARETISSRLNLGWSVEDALTKPVRNTERLITFNGKTQNLSEWSKETGLKITTLITRLDKIGMSVEDALTKPLSNEGIMLTYEGKTQNLFAWSKEKGINLDTLVYRVKANWPAERIFSATQRKLK